MNDTDAYLGRWQLVPEFSLYEHGPLPARGVYEIERTELGLQFRIRWSLGAEFPEQSTAFAAPPDRTPRRLPSAGTSARGPDSFTITRVDERTLDSATSREGTLVAHARRVASADGRLLAVVQEGSRPDGGRYRNFQVYRRLDEAGESESR